MSRKQKKKDAREQSTRQLMGIDEITDYSIATRMGELVFFIIKPTNISVLPDAGVGARIYALLNVVKGMAEIEMLALNSKESFENNKAFYRQRANEEELPVIRKLLEQDSKHLDRIQVLMASSREFYILVRLQGKKESDVFSQLHRAEDWMPPHAHPPAPVPRMGHHLRGGIPCGGAGGPKSILCRPECADPRHRAKVSSQTDGAEDYSFC